MLDARIMASRPPPPTAGGGYNLRVVVVDDDPRWREHAAAPFRKRGDLVLTYADGLEALAACVKEPPDVLLTDVQMPRMDGWQLLRTVRAQPALRALPVIFMTSLDGDAERMKGYQLGVDGYVPKPFHPDELLLRVHRIVRRAQVGPASEASRALRGDLEYVSASSLLSFLGIEQKTGVLLVVGEEVTRIFFRDGRPLRAEIEGAQPRLSSYDVVLNVLDWQSGQFEFNEEEVVVQDELDADVSSLVLDHARMKDEGRR
jgi:CheY-like chemotaxis protein